MIIYNSPAGPLRLHAEKGRLCLCDWVSAGRDRSSLLQKAGCAPLPFPEDATNVETGSSRIEAMAAGQLDEYFAGHRRSFEVPLMFAGPQSPLRGGDLAFRQSIWDALSGIEYGRTTSYGQIAAAIGRPEAVRAVANAIGANPLSIFIPCHRVIHSDGTVSGYLGGIEAKRFLLNMELEFCKDE